MTYPSELTDLPRWHCWVQRNGTKIPVQVDGFPAKANTPGTWTDFDTAKAAAPNYSGLACVIQDPFTGVDLDNCLNNGTLRDWAIPIVARLAPVSYSEISPSGTGIKFITRARKLEGARCVHKFGDDKQQLECYDHDRFWTMTGDVYSGFSVIGDGYGVINWICNEYLAQAEPKQPKAVRQVTIGSDLRQRAREYVDSCEPASEGNRNNAAFRVAGHVVKLVDENGYALPESEAREFVLRWNDRNFPPLPEDEIARVVTSAMKNGKPRNPKPPQIFVPDTDPAVDLSGILGTGKIDASFPMDCLAVPGFIGDVIKHNLTTAHYPLPELALAAALALMSTVTGGKVSFQRSRSNLYLMGLAPSGSGKDHARKLNREILHRSGFSTAVGPERIGSHAGIVSALAENWLTLLQIDEIGRLIATMQNSTKSPHLYNIASVLMQLYSSADSIWTADAYGDRKKVKQLEYPHCVVYGTSVPDGFWDSLTAENVSDGLLGRFLVFESPDYVDYQVPQDIEIPEHLIATATMWRELQTHAGNLAGTSNSDGAHPYRVDADEEARQRLQDHAMQISARRKTEEHVTAAVWSRSAEKTNKLALLFACSRWDGETWPTVRIEDADRAIRLNNWLTRRMIRQAGLHCASSQFEADQLKVLRVIQSRDEWTRNQLTRATRWLRVRDRNEILQTLQESEQITCFEEQTSGRSVLKIKAIFRT